MDGARYIAVKPLSGVLPEQARDTRVRAWAFVFQCWQEKQKATRPAPEPSGRDNARKESNHARAVTRNYT